jgi:energy-coupling factor transport system permease protein
MAMAQTAKTIKSLFAYTPTDSIIHQLNPVTKLLLFAVPELLAWFSANAVWTALIFFFGVAFFTFAKVPVTRLKMLHRILLLIGWGTALQWLSWSDIPGRVTYVTWPWGGYISDMTLVYALGMTVRMMTIVLLGFLFVATTRDRDLVYLCRVFRLPAAFSFVVTVGLRSGTLFLGDYFSIIEAQAGKGIEFNKGNVLRRAKNYIYVFIPMMVMGMRRMLDLTCAVESSGFDPNRKRTCYYEIPVSTRDRVIIASLIALFLVGLYLKLATTYLSAYSWPWWP